MATGIHIIHLVYVQNVFLDILASMLYTRGSECKIIYTNTHLMLVEWLMSYHLLIYSVIG